MVATDLASGSVPGLFQPVFIRGHEYVDGGLSSPVPARFGERQDTQTTGSILTRP